MKAIKNQSIYIIEDSDDEWSEKYQGMSKLVK